MATGQELKRTREAQGITQVDLAAEIENPDGTKGVRRQTVIQWEQRADVPRAVADRYIAAVDRLREKDR